MPRAILVEAVPHRECRCRRRREPPDVPAGRTPGIRDHGAAVLWLRVEGIAPETTHDVKKLERGGRSVSSYRLPTPERFRSLRNLRVSFTQIGRSVRRV